MADKRLEQLPTATTLGSSDLIHISQSGIDKRINSDVLVAQLNSGVAFNFQVKEESSTERTLSVSDRTSYIRCLNAGTTSIIVPPTSDVPWTLGDQVMVRRQGGKVNISGGSGVTINGGVTGLALLSGGQDGILTYVGSNTWDLETGGTTEGINGTVTDYDPLATYTEIDEWVREDGIIYRPDASLLPIGPEAFDASSWIISQITGAEDLPLVNKGVTTNVGSYLENKDVSTYAEMIMNHAATPYGVGSSIVLTGDGISGTFVVVEEIGHGITIERGIQVRLDSNHLAKRLYEGNINPLWYEAYGDGITNDAGRVAQASLDGDLILTAPHYIGNSATISNRLDTAGGYLIVAPTATIALPNDKVKLSTFNVIPNSESDAQHNSEAIAAMIRSLNGGGVLEADGESYYFDSAIKLRTGQSIIGSNVVSYREDTDAQTTFIFTEDSDGITYDGGTSNKNMLKNLKVLSNLTDYSSSGIGINFSANGSSVSSRALANIVDNVTIQGFNSGFHLGSPGEFNWFFEGSNIKIFRCMAGFIVDGSNGSGKVDSLHIDASDGFSGGTTGIVFNNGNGFSISNFSLEKCSIGLEFNGDELNDRLYMNDGYVENCSSSDIIFKEDCFGQLFMNRVRFAYFDTTLKNQSIRAESNADVHVVISNVTFKGSDLSDDGLIRITRMDSSKTSLWLDGMLLQQDCGIWQDFSTGKAPIYIRLLNEDLNGNYFTLSRNSIVPTDMIAETTRVTSVSPTSDTFVISTINGSTLDLKYTGATVKGVNPSSPQEWIWDGSSFITL